MRIKSVIENLLRAINEDTDRVGLKDTPDRVERMFGEIFKGYDASKKPKLTVFDNNKDGIEYDQVIADTGTFYSTCEHHMMTFWGTYYFGYIPKRKILGLSKVARVVDFYSSKLQVQERLTKEIVDELESALHPEGIALVLKGRHLCKEMRGVKQTNGEMVTSEMRGVFRKDGVARSEFLQLTKRTQ